MYLILFIARLLLAAVFLIAGISKLLSGLTKSRRTLRVLSWLAVSMSIVLPCAELNVYVPQGVLRRSCIACNK